MLFLIHKFKRTKKKKERLFLLLYFMLKFKTKYNQANNIKFK